MHWRGGYDLLHLGLVRHSRGILALLTQSYVLFIHIKFEPILAEALPIRLTSEIAHDLLVLMLSK